MQFDMSTKPTRRKKVSPAERAIKHLHEGRTSDAMAWAGENMRADEATDCLSAAKIFKAVGNLDAVLEIYQALANRDPQSKGWQVAVACVLAELGGGERLHQHLDSSPLLRPLLGDDHALLASAFRSGNHLESAVEHYEAAISKGMSDRLNTSIGLAAVLVQLNRPAAAVLEKALATYHSSDDLKDNKTAAIGWFNLGVLQEKDQPSEAIASFQNSLKLDPEYERPIANLAILLTGQGRLDETITLLQPAVQADADWPRTSLLLASAQRLKGDTHEAIKILKEVVAENESPSMAWELLVRSLVDDDDTEQAITVCQNWLKRDSDNAVALHMLSAVQGSSHPSQQPLRASENYIAATFDSFADSFDSVLENLDYRAPQLIGKLINDTLPPPAADLSVLDAGCGTGLAARFLQPYASKLTGVDLSSKMLGHARNRGGYDQLLCCDLIAHLKQQVSKYGLIAAADTFNYFGDLSELLPACFAALEPDGWLVFTLEQGDFYGDSYRLEPHGRYSHPPGYLMEHLGECGIEGGELHNAVLRKENGANVTGILAAVQKPA